jgi:cystathionine beta-lyase
MDMFDTIIDRRNTDSAKWQKYNDRDILPMWVADMDFRSPQPVLDALHERVDHGVFGYGVPAPELEEAICSYVRRTHAWGIDPGWIVWLPGLVSGLNVACRSVGNPGDAVLTSVPVYPPFLTAPGNVDRSLLKSRMRVKENQWVMDFSDIEKKAATNTRLFILCNPHNPTGRVFTPDELNRLADICAHHNVVICADEIHCDLVLEPGCRHIPLASLSDEIASNTITLMAPSKTFNIPGLSCSFAVIPNDGLRRRFKKAMGGIVPHNNVLGMVAARAAYEHGGPWLEALLDYLRINRDMLTETVAQMPGLEMTPIEATYLAWIDVRNVPVANAMQWFEDAGVGLSNGDEFDGHGYLRLNFGCPRPILHQALERISRALAGLAFAS